ncbi:MAG TPA: protein kinase [Kofleriaceae bacterium]|nr:protein kinase [Kofleriaceae bacterium]
MSLPQSFGRYRVTGSLGAGAMGEVLSAVDELLGREVAVKTLKGRSSGLAARIADERFRLEARAIAQLTHPSVVQVYDLDLQADPPYLVMERVAGPSLKDQIADGPLPEREVRALGIQMANALATAHARGVVHRDVKPANILAAGPGTWKLADFGVAHVPDSSLTMTGQFVGSPAYAPPEALVRGQLGPEGDVFSLGATLYQAAAGEWPRATQEVRGLLAPIPPLSSIAPGVAPDLAAAIDRAVAVDPSARPTAAELALALAMVPGMATPPAGVAAVSMPMPGQAPGWTPTPVPGSIPTPVPGSIPTGTATGPVGVVGAVGAVGALGSATSIGWTSSTSSGTSPPLGARAETGAPVPGAADTSGAMATGASGAMATSAGAGASAAKFRWKHAVAGIVTLLAILVIAIARSSPSAPSDAKPLDPSKVFDPGPAGGGGGGERDERGGRGDEPDESGEVPRVIEAHPPPITSHEAAKDWRKVIEKLQRQQFRDARMKLAEWETKHGPTDETSRLAKQLDAVLRAQGRGGRDREDD